MLGKMKKFICRIGWHNWSENRNGVRICNWCPAVDRYYGISGFLRKIHEKQDGVKESDATLRAWWNRWPK
jgi:hypothetical protein